MLAWLLEEVMMGKPLIAPICPAVCDTDFVADSRPVEEFDVESNNGESRAVVVPFALVEEYRVTEFRGSRFV